MKKTHLPVLFLELSVINENRKVSSVYDSLADLSFSSVDSNTVYAFDSIRCSSGRLILDQTFQKFIDVVAAAFVFDSEVVVCAYIMNFASLSSCNSICPAIYANLANLVEHSPTARISSHIDQLSL